MSPEFLDWLKSISQEGSVIDPAQIQPLYDYWQKNIQSKPQTPKATVKPEYIVLPNGQRVNLIGEKWKPIKRVVEPRLEGAGFDSDNTPVTKVYFMPLVDINELHSNDVINELYNSIMFTEMDDPTPHLATDVQKIKNEITPQTARQMGILASLEDTAIKKGVLSQADIDGNDVIRTLMADIVKQWGTGKEYGTDIMAKEGKKGQLTAIREGQNVPGLPVDPLRKLALVKQYLPNIEKFDQTTEEGRALAGKQLELARGIASVPEDKIPEFVQQGLQQMQTARLGAALRKVPPKLPTGDTVSGEITQNDIERGVREQQPLSGTITLPQGMTPQFGTPAQLQTTTDPGTAAVLANAEGERRLKIRKQYEARWRELVEQARNQMQSPQKIARF